MKKQRITSSDGTTAYTHLEHQRVHIAQEGVTYTLPLNSHIATLLAQKLKQQPRA